MKKTLMATLIGSTLLIPSINAGDYVTIGSGGLGGVYYPTAGSICRMVNQNDVGFKCVVKSTGGSIYNINNIRSNNLQFGIAQSDWQYHAYKGTSKFKSKGAFKNLRAVFSIHGEPFTMLAREDAEIKNFEDLIAMRVNLGEEGSGTKGTMELAIKAENWTNDTFAQTLNIKTADQPAGLCDGDFDAMAYVVGHPSNTIKTATELCKTKLVNVDDAQIRKLVDSNPFYKFTTIPGGIYANNPDPVSTFGVAATFVTSSDVPEATVYNMVKTVFENFQKFTHLHPAFLHLQMKEMIKDGLSAPLHRGAIKYYKEMGLM